MKEEINDGFTDQMKDYLNELVNKSLTIQDKTMLNKNCMLSMFGFDMPIKVDDIKLLYIGAFLLPNIMNYLVNILPQFLYPYCVAYLQDLSTMRDDPVTINEIFDYLIELNNGNIHLNTDAEG